MTMATRAPVIIPSMATPNRISSQLTIRPPGDVTKAESPAPRTVAIPQLNESNSDWNVRVGFSSRVISTAAISDHEDDPLGQREEEPAVELTADATQVPRHAPDDRAGEDRGERHGSASVHDRAIPGRVHVNRRRVLGPPGRAVASVPVVGAPGS